MRLKKIFKYTGITLGALVGVSVVAGASVWFSSTLSTKVLNFVATKVPGLTWEKVEGSFSSGIKITNLHYISQNYKYNPQVTLKPETEQDEPIPTLVDVKVAYATLHLDIGCLVRKQVCLDNLNLEQTQVTLATGDETQLDPQALLYGTGKAYNPNNLANPNYQEQPSSGVPEWLDIVLEQAKITDLQVVVGKNIGLYQQHLNQELRQDGQASTNYKPVLTEFKLGSYPQSVFNQYLTDPMVISLDQLQVGAVRYRPTAYDLGDVSLGKLSYAQYGQEVASAVNNDLASQTPPEVIQATEQEQPKFEGKALPPELQKLLSKYLNLQAGSFSQAFSQIKQAFSLEYKQNANDANDFEISLPQLLSEEQFEQQTNELNSAVVEETTPENDQELWQSLTGYQGEFKFVKPEGQGKELPASKVSSQIADSFKFFRTPLRDFFLTNTQLNLPLALTSQNVTVNEVNLSFYTYKVKGLEPEVATSDTFQVNNISLDGNLTPEQANLKAKVSGDVELEAQVDFLARTSDLNAQIALKVHKLPLVSLPVAIDANISATGKAYSNVQILATNKAQNAQLSLMLDLDTGRPYWPMDLNLQLATLALDAGTKISDLNLTAKGRVNNLNAKLSTNLLFKQQNYAFNASLVNVPQKFATEITFVNQHKAKVQPALHAYFQFDYNKQLVLQGLLKAKDIRVQDFADLGKIKDLTISGSFNLGAIYNSQQDWSAFFKEASFVGTLDQRPFEGNLLLGVDSVFGLLAQKVNAEYLENHVRVEGSLNRQSDFNLDLKLVDLSKLVPGLKINSQANLKLAGSILVPSLQGTINTPYVHYQASGVNLNINQFHTKLDLTMDESLTGEANLSLAKSTINDLVINHAKVTYNGDPQNIVNIDFSSNQAVLLTEIDNFTLSKAGDLTADISLNRLDLVALNLKNFKTTDGDIKVNLNTNNFNFTVSPFTVSNNQFNLTNETDLVYDSKSLTGKISTNLDLDLLNSLLKENKIFMQGKVKATADFALDLQDLNSEKSQLSVNLASSQVDYHQLIDVRPFKVSIYDLDLTSSLKGNDLQTKGSLQINRQGNVSLNVTVGDLFKQQTLAGSLILDSLSLNLIKPLLDNTQQITGNMYANLEFGGTLRQPLLYGQTGASDLNVAMVDLPFTISKGALVLSFDGRKADILGDLPTDSTAIEISGSADWNTIEQLTSNVRVQAKDLRTKLMDYGVALVDTDITAEYANNFLTVNGQARVHDGTLTVASSDDATYLAPSGDVVFVTNDNLVDTTIIDGKDTPSNLLANIKVTLGDNLIFDAYGVNASLVGNLDVTYAESPSIIGNISIENGTFRQYGQNLIIQRGEITFNGLSVIPNIYIRAIRDPNYVMDNVTVGVQVQGLATKPNISLFSTPASLSQNQKINYLLTGTASDSDDDGVGLQLFTSSLTSSISLFEQIGNAFGIKNTQVTTSGSGENSKVNISGTVFNKVRLNYAYGLFDGLNTISASYRVLPKVFLRVSRGVSAAADVVYSTAW
ncbi:translocation/assembly module TamB domain-containing protein [Psittacicella gerlachiana]|uniref:Translocation and assembly module TamB C-terminal domain-containing protein n=1 Tax=Psittacicella gerlachiana TaxID=2028574 RepID=A0A3A1YPH2_9GAMM|nr:translocation/assembly module TamB domain-containing protein [Psittacicella gerlachiana]RIY37927.1 hypothetical protein CKF59_01185 [Psittacicella gerlachiana]